MAKSNNMKDLLKQRMSAAQQVSEMEIGNRAYLEQIGSEAELEEMFLEFLKETAHKRATLSRGLYFSRTIDNAFLN